MRAGPHQFFAGISSPNSSLSLSKRQAPSVSPPAPSATASDERTCSSEPGERDRSSPPRRGSSPTPQAGASPKDAGCSRPPSRRGHVFLWPPCSWSGGGRLKKIPSASPSSFSPRRCPPRSRCSRASALGSALLVSRPRSVSSRREGRPLARRCPETVARERVWTGLCERYQTRPALPQRGKAERQSKSLPSGGMNEGVREIGEFNYKQGTTRCHHHWHHRGEGRSVIIIIITVIVTVVVIVLVTVTVLIIISRTSVRLQPLSY